MRLLADLFGTNDAYALLFVGGMIMLAYMAVRMRSNALTKRELQMRGRPGPPVSATARPEQVRAMAAELGDLLAEVHETARRLTAQIENRTDRLDALLAEADDKIRQLEALRRELADAGVTPEAGDPAPQVAQDPRHARIYDLADRGHSAREIAQQLDMPPGEVELILNLRANPSRA